MSAPLRLDGELEHQHVVDLVRAYVEQHYPRLCPCCGRRYEDAADFLANTRQLGFPVSCDAELDDWQPRHPIGTLSFSNCGCGTTLSVGSQGLPVRTMWALLAWMARSVHMRGMRPKEVLDELRHDVDVALIGEAATARREGR